MIHPWAKPEITLMHVVFPHSKPMPPLGLMYLIAALEEIDVEVEFRDYMLCTLPWPKRPETFAEWLDDIESPIIGIGCQTYPLPWVLAGLKIYKERHPDKKVILGNIGPSATPRQLIERFPYIDYVLAGEADDSLPAFMQAIKSGASLEHVPGLTWRSDGVVRTSPKPSRINDLDRLRRPAYHAVDMSKYFLVNIMSARGCPYHCTFCSIVPMWDFKVKYFSPERFVDEIEHVATTYGHSKFAIIDDTFVVDRPRATRIAELIAERDLGIEWNCYGRTNLMTHEMMETFSRAGCKKVFYGFEAGSQRLLKDLKKTVKFEHHLQTTIDSLQYFEIVLASFVWGFPQETMDDFYDSLFTMLSLIDRGVAVEFNPLILYPGTELYAEYSALLEFDRNRPDLSPQLLNQFYDVTKRISVTAQDDPRIYDLIEGNPDIFAPFYYARTESMEEKHRIMRDQQWSINDTRNAWEIAC